MIDPRLQLACAVDALIHEWTHARLAEAGVEPGPSQRSPGLTSDHDDAFWIEFGKLYRVWVDEP